MFQPAILLRRMALLATLSASLFATSALPAGVSASALTGSAGTSGCGTPHSAGDVIGQVQVGGITRPYRVHVPTGYTGQQPLPLLFSFHGAAATFLGDPTWLQEYMTDQNPDADARGYIVVYPRGLYNTWDVFGTQDVTYVDAVRQQVEAEYCVDPTHVSATGLSMGAIFVWYLATKVPWLAAVMPVCGTEPGYYATFHPSHPTSLLVIAGTNDPKVPYYGSPSLWGMPIAVPSIPTDVQQWAAYQGNTDVTTGLISPTIQGDLPVSTTVYTSPTRPTLSVQLYSVVGGGHEWFGPHYLDPAYLPGTRTIDATTLVSQFLLDHPLITS